MKDNELFLFPEPDEDILLLKKSFKEYCRTLETEEDNEGDVYGNWASIPSETLSGITPLDFIKRYVGDPPAFERYEKLVLCMLSDTVYSLPVEVMLDFEEACGDIDAWSNDIFKKCLGNFRSEDRRLTVPSFIFLNRLADVFTDFPDDVYDLLIGTSEDYMLKDPDTASGLLSIGITCCKNGFEKTLALLKERYERDGGFGEFEETMLSQICVHGKRSNDLYSLLRTLVKKTDNRSKSLKLFFMFVEDYGDPRAVSFLRTKVSSIREELAEVHIDSDDAKILFDNAMEGDAVIKKLGGEGFF